MSDDTPALVARLYALRHALARACPPARLPALPPFAFDFDECVEVVRYSRFHGEFGPDTLPQVGSKWTVLGFDGIVVRVQK